MKRFALIGAVVLVSTGCLRPIRQVEPHVEAALANPMRLDIAWRYSAGREAYFDFRPQELAGVDVSVDGRVVIAATSRGQLVALGTDDGALRWLSDEGESFASRPLAVDGAVYIGYPDGTFRALDARTGTEIWRAVTGGPIASRAVVAEDSVLVMSGDGALYAFDRASGSQRWSVERRRPIELTVLGDAPPAVDGAGIVAGFADGTLLAVASDGTVQWSADVSGDVDVFPDVTAGPVFADDLVIAASFGGGLAAFGRDDGEVSWRRDLLDLIWLGVDSDSLVAVDADGVVRYLDAATGETTAELTLDAVPLAAEFVDDGLFVVSTSARGMYFVDARQPWIHHRFAPGEGISSPPVWFGERIFVLSDGGYVYGLDVFR